jgi:hypothetical protein
VAIVRNRVRDRTGDALNFDWGNAVRILKHFKRESHFSIDLPDRSG